MERLYKICCAVMGAVMIFVLVLTFYIGFSGKNPDSEVFGRILVIAMMSVMAVFTVIGLVFMKVGGRLAYKIGFYVLHGGMIVLIAGLIITNIASSKESFVVLKNEVGVKTTNAVVDRQTGRTVLKFDHLIGVDGYGTEYYDEAQTSPKSYYAVIGVYDRVSRQKLETKTVSMNHPVRIDGYKIYLMNVYPEGGTPGADGALHYPEGAVELMAKSNPGEYVVIFGFVSTLAGITLSCFAGVKNTAKAEKSAGPSNSEEDGPGSPAPKKPGRASAKRREVKKDA